VDRYLSVPMTLSNHYPGFKVTVYLQAEYLKNGPSYRESYINQSIN